MKYGSIKFLKVTKLGDYVAGIPTKVRVDLGYNASLNGPLLFNIFFSRALPGFHSSV